MHISGTKLQDCLLAVTESKLHSLQCGCNYRLTRQEGEPPETTYPAFSVREPYVIDGSAGPIARLLPLSRAPITCPGRVHRKFYGAVTVG